MRRKGVISLTVWMACAVVILAPSPSAGACVWCNADQWLNFQDCLYWGIRNQQSLSQISVGALDDMKNSITAASQAISSTGSSSMKMKMLIGAMAGEMSGLIQPMSSTGDGGWAKAILMSLVQTCNVEVTGSPDIGFIDELGRTLDFMMNEPSYASPQSDSNNTPPQNAGQSFGNPATFNGQNNYGPPPNFNNVRQPQSQSQLPTAGTIPYNAAAYRGNNQQAPSGIPFPNNQNAGSRFPAQAAPGQRDINTGSLSYPSQPQIMNANGANDFNTFNQNPSLNPSISNANAASNSYSFAQSSGAQQQINNANFERRPNEMYPTVQAKNTNINPGSTPYPLNSGSFIQPQITRANAASSANSYSLANANSISNTNQNIPQNNIQNQFPPGNVFPINNQVPSYPTNNLQNQQFPAQSSINQQQSSFGGSDTKTFEKNAQNVPQNYQQNQFIQYPVSNGNGLGQSGTYPLNNNQSQTGQSGTYQLNNIQRQTDQSGTYPLNNIQRQPDQSNVGASPYNEFPPNYDYYYYWFPNQDYPNNPDSNTPYGPSSGSSVVTNSNSQSFITQGSGNSPSNFPVGTNKTPSKGKKIQKKTPDLKQQQNKINGVANQKSSNDDDVARAMRFVETIYVILSQSNDFKGVFNEQIPNDQALSLVYTIDVGALNDCGYSRFSVEIANACTVVIQSLPDGCSFVQYAEALSKALMDQLNMKKLIGGNPEDQAKCIANNLLTRLNQKVSIVITTTTVKPPVAANSDSTFSQGLGSQPQVTNENSGTYYYPLYQNPNGAKINRPNTYQNIPVNNVPINSAVPSNLINKPQNQLNIAPGPINQQQDSSATASNGVQNAAIIFYQQLSNNLLTSPYMSSIYNKDTTKTNTKTITAALLLNSLSTDYGNLAIEITRECIRRLGSVQAGSNTEAYTSLITTCITDGFSYYGLISQENASAQASDISSKIIAWLKGDTNNQNNNQLANRNIDVQSNMPNQGATDYPDSYSGIPNLSQWQQPASSEVSASNSAANTDYNSNTDSSAPQYLPYDYQNFNSNSAPITNDNLQKIRSSSSANSSLVKTNIKKGKNNKKRPKKKKPAVSKTNFNFDNLNNNYPYSGSPVNSAAKSKPNSPPDFSNVNYFKDYNGNLNYQPDYVPYTQLPDFQDYPAQYVNPDYDLTAGAIKTNNGNIPGPQQSSSAPNTQLPDFQNYPAQYPVNSAAKSNPNSPPDISNVNYFKDYNGNLNYQPDYAPNTQLPDFQDYPAQYVNPDYGLTAGAVKTNNGNIPGPQQSSSVPNTQLLDYQNYPAQYVNPDYYLTAGAIKTKNGNLSGPQQSSSVVNKSAGRKKCKKIKNRKGNNAANKPPISDASDASNNPLNQPSALDMTNNPQTFQSNDYTGPLSNNYGAIPDQNTPPVSSQSQIIPDEKNDEVKDRIRYLTKGVLSSMSNGNFDYKNFSDIIAKISENLQTTHPELGSQTSLIKTLIDSIIACTQLLTKVPPNYFGDIGVLQNSDIPDAAAVDYSNSILPIQGDQSAIQTNQNNVALNDQSYGPPTLPQQNNLNDQIGQGNFYPGGSAPLPNTNQPPTLPQQNNLNNYQTGQRNVYPGGSAPLPNTNQPPTRPGFGGQSFPQDVGGNALPNAQTSRGISPQIPQDNSFSRLPNGYGSQNVPLNNQNNLAYQPSGGFNNQNLQPGNMGNQNIQSRNPYLTG